MAAGGQAPGAVILAGGKSSRMGTDKALLRLQPEGLRLIELVLTAVRPLVGSVVISTNRPEDYGWLGYPLVRDRLAGAGPMAGLEAGLEASPARYNIIVACDMPQVETGLLKYLLAQAEGYAAVVPLNEEQKPEPLCAVYSKDCLPAIRRYLAAGSLKMAGWLGEVSTRFVPAAELKAFDPDLHSFRNLNSPEDLRQVGEFR